MTLTNWVITAPIVLIVVYIILYTGARLVGAAWFRSKMDVFSHKKDN